MSDKMAKAADRTENVELLNDEAVGPINNNKKTKKKKEINKCKIWPPKIIDDVESKTPFLGIFVTFGKHMSKFFGVDEDETLVIGQHRNISVREMSNFYHKLTPDFNKPEISTLMLYSDIVLPKICVGDSLTNILDIISMPHAGTFQRSNAIGSYRPLKNHTINTISIAIYDKDGDEVFFPKNSFSALELELRPITIDM